MTMRSESRSFNRGPRSSTGQRAHAVPLQVAVKRRAMIRNLTLGATSGSAPARCEAPSVQLPPRLRAPCSRFPMRCVIASITPRWRAMLTWTNGPQTYRFMWRDIEIEATYTPRDYCGAITHLGIRSIRSNGRTAANHQHRLFWALPPDRHHRSPRPRRRRTRHGVAGRESGNQPRMALGRPVLPAPTAATERVKGIEPSS